jgi:hypothetical protein
MQTQENKVQFPSVLLSMKWSVHVTHQTLASEVHPSLEHAKCLPDYYYYLLIPYHGFMTAICCHAGEQRNDGVIKSWWQEVDGGRRL